MDEKIKNLLSELGLPCNIKKVVSAPNCNVIHFDCKNIKQIADIPKKIKILKAYLHIDITMAKTNIAHFALSIPMKNNCVDFYDKKYEYLFDELEDKPSGKSIKIFAGIDDNNQPIMIDINENPHILIAGTTGSGKSIMINSAICSLIRTLSYSNFIMIDTKKVELSFYKNYEFCEFVDNAQDAVDILFKVCYKIDCIYSELEKQNLKKIKDDASHTFIVIEELGDLMSSQNHKLIEQYIVKIARLGRACGIHLIIATQRPTVDVVTGEIKANIGCRFALQTTSGIDSRNILGHNGAENLKGKGDCLLKLPTQSEEIHLQCPYISDEDIIKTIKGEFLFI